MGKLTCKDCADYSACNEFLNLKEAIAMDNGRIPIQNLSIKDYPICKDFTERQESPTYT